MWRRQDKACRFYKMKFGARGSKFIFADRLLLHVLFDRSNNLLAKLADGIELDNIDTRQLLGKGVLP